MHVGAEHRNQRLDSNVVGRCYIHVVAYTVRIGWVAGLGRYS